MKGLLSRLATLLIFPTKHCAFDRTLSMLALDVLPDPSRGLHEMRRVTRKGGTVAVVVNDFRCGWTPFSLGCRRGAGSTRGRNTR
jgi:ubiquinone/menaquinone biosynthesis C-methylase UbiE